MAASAATNSHHCPTNLTKLAPKLSEITPQFLNVASHSARISSNRVASLLVAHCCAKPNADKKTPSNANDSCADSDSPLDSAQASSNLGQSEIPSSSMFTRGLVLDLGPNDSWDSLEIGSPVVKRYLSDDEERWYMWYHGRSGENPEFDSMGLAVSGNGIHWERGGQRVRRNADVGLVMSRSDDWWAFDTHGVRPCEILIMSSNKVRANSGVYWLYYTGFYSEEIENLDDRNLEFDLQKFERGLLNLDGASNGRTLRSLPGLAMSQDGRHWARIEGEHHSGALIGLGSDGDWDSTFIASPQVIFHEARDLRMYYHSFDAENRHFGIGVARSRDGMRWVKLGKVLGAGGTGAFDECGVVNPRVVRCRKDGKYLMAYEGIGADGRRAVGVAVSTDGLRQWRRVEEGPVFRQSGDGGWDCEGVGMPCLVEMHGEMEQWRLYYRGMGKEGRTGIGLAVCEGSELRSFQRWTGFHI